MTYLDWTMVILTCVSCISMMFETPWPLEDQHLIQHDPYLRVRISSRAGEGRAG